MARAIFQVERELGVCITADYPLTKFLSQIDALRWYREEEQKEADRAQYNRR
jgi:hypothetical protein